MQLVFVLLRRYMTTASLGVVGPIFAANMLSSSVLPSDPPVNLYEGIVLHTHTSTLSTVGTSTAHNKATQATDESVSIY